MKQNLDTNVPIAPVVDDNKQDSSNGLKIATAVACVVAICGIGFGVYGMMQSLQKDNQISELKTQILNNSELKPQIENNTKPADDVPISGDSNSFELFSTNIDGGISFYAGDYGSVHIDDAHNLKIIVGQSKTTLLEEEGVALAYYINLASWKQDGDVKQLEGYMPYVYYVTNDGAVYRIRVDSETSVSEIIDGCKNIVSIASSSNPNRPVTMIDINGNICQDI